MGKTKKAHKKLRKVVSSVALVRRNVQDQVNETQATGMDVASSAPGVIGSTSTSSSSTTTTTYGDNNEPLLPNESASGDQPGAVALGPTAPEAPGPDTVLVAPMSPKNSQDMAGEHVPADLQLPANHEPAPPTTKKQQHSNQVDEEIQHPRNVLYQEAQQLKGGHQIHSWKRWECCKCGKQTHYDPTELYTMGKHQKARKKLRKMTGSISGFHRHTQGQEQASNNDTESPTEIDSSGPSSTSSSSIAGCDNDHEAPLLPREQNAENLNAANPGYTTALSNASTTNVTMTTSPIPLQETASAKSASDASDDNIAGQTITLGTLNDEVPAASETAPPQTKQQQQHQEHNEVDDNVEHPRNKVYQDPLQIKGGYEVHLWKKWECCLCGKQTFYGSNVCSFLECCHRRCAALCTTLEASDA
ncbi:hypothetical protein HDK64DRAFT_323816 [Phyllosticta capitalensis]